MPNPKRRHSKQRSAKRRTHYKAKLSTYSVDKTTGEHHVRHCGHIHENHLYYKGELIAKDIK